MPNLGFKAVSSQATLSNAQREKSRASDTAAAHLVSRVPRAYREETVAQILETLRQESLNTRMKSIFSTGKANGLAPST